ncbi:precorrin-2 dehydrogenase [Clostridium beijerinckii]|jgi:precorrin-2 dehydrogenase/sirohydrochlorin ferrochelatase|uniref:precorrin-2 dehydrogenase n=1 Tax=Clostridium beijerinckii TaxID=1520 RepID=A0AB74VK98_CLOBE|nr:MULTISPECIES: NAD(P)-dependent oxidoreductase [Clostridium]MCI1477569.1 NAD(P)-dependent oxidoreductase [Clostridium beijerinckii]MCI1577347.1 NAD(P)-dependent oxidoreductase [Clostridium beijerinckii]MCI1582973.1 NAD(P)-dependent oxidoreductase [Clostridium beijerinckii]MCI1621307.1 NAD(P)-dependent oxidoreductase [Clostridium beijerinckii]NRT77052.1 precorrin-2 dehydrogenase/sirohydrochlorin ferrochelatase [Clostridium beijerinckii]
MDRDNRENIYDQGIEYSYISLISKKLRVGIVGGGKAGTIKARHFVKNKCCVEVISKTFDGELIELSKEFSEILKLKNEDLSYEFLRDKHLIIIALDDENLKNIVKKYCEENYKIYIDSSDFISGMGVVPIQRSTENVVFALNTNYGNPKGAVLLSNKVEKTIKEYDEFIRYIGLIRNKAKSFPEFKMQITSFIGNDEFKKSFDNGEAEKALRSRFSKEIVDYLIKF